MTLLERIKADSIEARKAKSATKASLLTTLYSEAAMVGKNKRNDVSTDEEVMAMIQKFVKNAIEVRDISATKGFCIEESKAREEIAILTGYLPTMISEAELGDLIVKIMKEQGLPANMGKIMAQLKAVIPGQYDGKVASALIKQMMGVAK